MSGDIRNYLTRPSVQNAALAAAVGGVAAYYNSCPVIGLVVASSGLIIKGVGEVIKHNELKNAQREIQIRAGVNTLIPHLEAVQAGLVPPAQLQALTDGANQLTSLMGLGYPPDLHPQILTLSGHIEASLTRTGDPAAEVALTALQRLVPPAPPAATAPPLPMVDFQPEINALVRTKQILLTPEAKTVHFRAEQPIRFDEAPDGTTMVTASVQALANVLPEMQELPNQIERCIQSQTALFSSLGAAGLGNKFRGALSRDHQLALNAIAALYSQHRTFAPAQLEAFREPLRALSGGEVLEKLTDLTPYQRGQIRALSLLLEFNHVVSLPEQVDRQSVIDLYNAIRSYDRNLPEDFTVALPNEIIKTCHQVIDFIAQNPNIHIEENLKSEVHEKGPAGDRCVAVVCVDNGSATARVVKTAKGRFFDSKMWLRCENLRSRLLEKNPLQFMDEGTPVIGIWVKETPRK